MLLAHKIRFYPTSLQKEKLAQSFGNNRWYWNQLLANAKLPKDDRKQIRYSELKADNEWLKLAEAQGYANTEMHFRQAFKNMKANKKFRFPKFKSKHSKQSYTTCQPGKLVGKSLSLAKIGKIKLAQELRYDGRIKSVTISKNCADEYYCSFLVETQPTVLETTGAIIGLDMGLIDFISDSNGNKIPNPRIANENERVKKYQRLLARKQKGSNNRAKARVKLAKAYQRNTNKRKDFLHKLSKKYINENQIICIETLRVKNMMKNHNLARSFGYTAISKFIEMLRYKANMYGRQIIQVPTLYPSSQICNICQTKDKPKQLNIREWVCPTCGAILDRDYNAAMNILTAGIAEIACCQQ